MSRCRRRVAPGTAQWFWKALPGDASGLIVDARILLEHSSYGTAPSLTVLAEEELGKAVWIYGTFKQTWSDGTD